MLYKNRTKKEQDSKFEIRQAFFQCEVVSVFEDIEIHGGTEAVARIVAAGGRNNDVIVVVRNKPSGWRFWYGVTSDESDIFAIQGVCHDQTQISSVCIIVLLLLFHMLSLFFLFLAGCDGRARLALKIVVLVAFRFSSEISERVAHLFVALIGVQFDPFV